MTGIIFGSSMGNTEEAANLIASNLGIDNVLNIADTDAKTINSFDKLIIGSSTWGSGDLQDDWDVFDFDSLDVSGKTVALFGLGDSSSYSDTYCDAMGIIYDKLVQKGANIIGQVSADGYSFDESRSLKDGKFVGLALDADNESDQTEERIKKWTESIKSQIL
ncbi:flavodoxin FldA [Campylobacter hyointestinalis]|uniref:Flavodoxin n=1 Tax=Campylobacter hyointestinalis TaxID=198 RepID=A0A562XBS3_CAMHY|nr:flavodoxin FldA [Campylobacter hyointestinalis]RAZ25874.1 flavodoxin [Campylobacter hyointestinalis subsp. lawsonii]RAZ39983.1 flavodoxin [Campylobacter hyointestinalis subsp. lawsonii]RAZ54481.1 flavodoxin [Campylobacter hyointestinalis subsp. lawsonii]RAZ63122.1 flavodoxin [Campylobacter hyointestinalis subsp. lawsonii]TWO19582.1 flavodoxin FldA [Campylobacter hyointestinalis]